MRAFTAGLILDGTTDREISTTRAPDRFTTLPDDRTRTATVVALEERGFSVHVLDCLGAAREALLARIPKIIRDNRHIGHLQETGTADAINNGGPYESMRNALLALDCATRLQEMKTIGGQPDYALGHAVTRDGTLVIASASGSPRRGG
jgi:hypothetical protein